MNNPKIQINEYCHVFNRGVDKRKVFLNKNDYFRFLKSMVEFNTIKPIGSLQIKEKNKNNNLADVNSEKNKPLVEIIAYCLNENHFHLLLKSCAENGPSKYIKRLVGGYTWHFNYKYKRSGSLFQGRYKSIKIDQDNYLVYLSAYINGNSEIHNISKANSWKWSSFKEYLNPTSKGICNKNPILNQFDSIKDYNEFLNMIIKESSQRKTDLKRYELEK